MEFNIPSFYPLAPLWRAEREMYFKRHGYGAAPLVFKWAWLESKFDAFDVFDNGEPDCLVEQVHREAIELFGGSVDEY